MIAPIDEEPEKPERGIDIAWHSIAHPEKAKFLAALSIVGVIAKACRMSRTPRRNHYNWLASDPEYAAAVDEAMEIAVENAEAIMWKRGLRGYLEDVYYKGEVVGQQRRFSDTLAIFMMKGAKPEKYRERQDTRVSGDLGHHHTIEQVQRLVEETRADPDYVAAQRKRLSGAKIIAGVHGAGSVNGSVANGEAPGSG